MSVKTLHHWDAIGLVRPSGRTAGGYRVYSGDDVARVHRVLVYRELGFPLAEAEEMPNIAPDATAIAFGDFGRGYLIVDRMGIRVLRDPYTAKPYVLFYTTKRVGGGMQDFEAIKLLKFGQD